MATATKRRVRESHGPTPHSVAIFARPPLTRPAEHLILERRKREEIRDIADSHVHYNKQADLKSTWEKSTDKKIQRNTVNRRVDGILKQAETHLNIRRQKLRDLLAREEEFYLEEMLSKEETVLERQARMRERAKELKERRETERRKIVAEKLDRKWRDECEEARAIMSQRHRDEIFADREEQVRLKEATKREERRVDGMYADLWEADKRAKERREEMEAAAKRDRNQEMVKVLEIQMAALDVQRNEEKRLKEQEAELLKEERELRKLEDRRRREEKLEGQQEMRKMLALSLKMKMKKQAREIQEELAIDMKILEEILEQTRNEAQSQLQRKKELREEMTRYRDYLREVRAEEKRREKELDDLLNAEVEKTWQKRVAQWKIEKQARDRLMKDVLAARERQIKERLELNRREQEEARKEREVILRNIEEHKQLEAEQMEATKRTAKRYQSDLLEQAKYQNMVKEREKREIELEFARGQDAEREYQKKLQTVLNGTSLSMRPHPMKRY